MDPMHREQLTYSLQRLFESIFGGGGVRRFNSVYEHISVDLTYNIIE